METLAERPACMLPRQTLQEETVRPLSFPQERMWLLDQIDPGAATCNRGTAVARPDWRPWLEILSAPVVS